MGILRRAEAADLPALLAIHAGRTELPPWTRAHFEAELREAKSYLCVYADDDGAVRGYAGLWKLPPEAQVTIVAVDRTRTREGIGARLMERLHQEARGAGCGLIGLEVHEKNEAAIGLYRRLGYQVVGRRPNYYNDGSSALLMSLRLG